MSSLSPKPVNTNVDLVKEQALRERIVEEYHMDLIPGRICMSDHGSYIKVVKIYKKKTKKSVDTEPVDVIYVDYYGSANEGPETPAEKKDYIYDEINEVWWRKKVSTYNIREVKNYYNHVLYESVPELIKRTMEGAFTLEAPPVEDQVSKSTEIALRADKEVMFNMRREILRKAASLQARSSMLHILMDNKMQELNNIRSDFMKQIEKISKVIYTIELYLGIHEDIVQVLEGENASVDTPIHIRQQILYMDEEVGNYGQKEIDYANIEFFDEWVVENYKKIVPEERCIVALVPRRYTRVTNDPIADTIDREANKETYLLIRNGTNLYRVYTSVKMLPRLIPLQKDMSDMVKQMEDAEWDYERKNLKEKLEDNLFHYRRNIIILQGLIERTEIFLPLPFEGLNLLNPDTYGDYVVFIRDDEMLLPTGRKPYNQWHKDLNKDIKRGSRVYMSGRYQYQSYSYQRRDYTDRFLLNLVHDTSTPPLPGPGVYTVEEVKEIHREAIRDTEGKLVDNDPGYKNRGEKWYKEKKIVKKTHLVIKYNPGDEVINYWDRYDTGHARKKNLSFVIRPDDFFIFNYDLTDIEDINFYLESRIDRKEYVSMLPLLKGIRDMRLKEMEWEEHFIALTVNELKKEIEFEDTEALDAELTVRECIFWWKNKVIWKRPINKDDSKALRMIKARAKKLLLERL